MSKCPLPGATARTLISSWSCFPCIPGAHHLPHLNQEGDTGQHGTTRGWFALKGPWLICARRHFRDRDGWGLSELKDWLPRPGRTLLKWVSCTSKENVNRGGTSCQSHLGSRTPSCRPYKFICIQWDTENINKISNIFLNTEKHTDQEVLCELETAGLERQNRSLFG